MTLVAHKAYTCSKAVPDWLGVGESNPHALNRAKSRPKAVPDWLGVGESNPHALNRAKSRPKAVPALKLCPRWESNPHAP